MRKSKLMMCTLAPALLLAVGSDAALAQRGSSGPGQAPVPPGAQVPQRDLDRTRDRDTTGNQDRLRDRDQDRLHTAQLVEGQLAALGLLTDEERARFRSEMRNAATAAERSRIREQHQRTIQDRAREMGIEARVGVPLGDQARGGYMLMNMLTEQERAQFMNRMRSAQSAQERQRIRNEMHTMARERAREMGIDVPEWYGQSPGPR